MFLFSYLAFLCFVIGLIMTVAVLWMAPRSVLHWAMAVMAGGYTLYSFSYIWVFGADEPPTIWLFFQLSVWGFSLLIPSGALAAELLLVKTPRRWLLLIWAPLTAYWLFTAVWGTAERAIVVDFHPTRWGNASLHAHSPFLGMGAAVILAQKVLVWIVLWRARSKPGLKHLRGMLTIFVPADAAALVITATAQIVSSTTGGPSTAGLLGLINVGVLFLVVAGAHRAGNAAVPEAAKDTAPGNMNELLDRFGITPGEREVLALLLQGHDRKKIAELRFIAEGTVKTHIHSIYAKTGAKNRVELMLRLLSPS